MITKPLVMLQKSKRDLEAPALVAAEVLEEPRVTGVGCKALGRVANDHKKTSEMGEPLLLLPQPRQDPNIL